MIPVSYHVVAPPRSVMMKTPKKATTTAITLIGRSFSLRNAQAIMTTIIGERLEIKLTIPSGMNLTLCMRQMIESVPKITLKLSRMPT